MKCAATQQSICGPSFCRAGHIRTTRELFQETSATGFGGYVMVHGMSRQLQKWLGSLSELSEEISIGVVPHYTGVRRPGKGVADDKELRRRLRRSPGKVFSQVDTGAERCCC